MSGALINVASNPLALYQGDEHKDLVSGGGANFLPRIQITQSSTDAVKEGDLPMGEFIFHKGETAKALGKSIVGIPVTARPKAIDFSGDAPLQYFEANSPEFQAIKARANSVANSKCAYGYDWLIWFPDLQEFATFMFGSKTLRGLSPELGRMVGTAVNFKIKYIKSKSNGFSWFGADIFPSVENVSKLPTEDETNMATSQFMDAKSSVVEAADADSGTDRDR